MGRVGDEAMDRVGDEAMGRVGDVAMDRVGDVVMGRVGDEAERFVEVLSGLGRLANGGWSHGRRSAGVGRRARLSYFDRCGECPAG